VIDQAIQALAPVIRTKAACAAVGRARATHYRHHQPRPQRPPPLGRPRQPRALSPTEQAAVRAELHSQRFVDEAPPTVYAILLDEQRYLCSVSTMYRLLRADGEVAERRRQAHHPPTVTPELVASQPHAVWSWDITKLLGPTKWTYYHLYVVLDLYSRYVVGWLLADRERADLAEQLLAETIHKEGIAADQLTIHADRGTSMASKPVALLLADLGVTKSHSRPHVSHDNPYSEAQFKTLKYRPDFPERFASSEQARAFCQQFFRWYNHQHRHSGIGYHTPADVHHGHARQVHPQRLQVLQAAYALHPERFVRQVPIPPTLPRPAWINPPQQVLSTP